MFPKSRFWLKPFSLGIVPGMSHSERTGLHAINYVVFTAGAGSLFFTVLNAVQGNWHLFPFNLAVFAISAVGFVFLWRKRGQAAVLLVCGCGGVVVTLQAQRTGNGVETGLLFLLVFTAFVVRGAWPRRCFAAAAAAAYLWVRLGHSAPTTIGPWRYAGNVLSGLVGLYGLVAIFRAVGERYRREAAARARELEEANAAKERLFAVVAHDLRAPVAHLRQSVDHFAEGRLTEAQFDEIRGILRVDLHRIHASIENILQWSSGQIAAPRSSPGPFLLADAVGEAIGLLSVVAKDKGIVFDVHIPEDAAVVADAGQLRAVLRNLLANAVKFSRRGGIVAVASSLSQRAGNVEGAEWIVSVSDPGSGGVSGAAAVRRFLSDGEKAEPAWGTAGERGFGLGLRLCRDFIEANGGMIGAEELPGGGTRVWVSVRALLAVVGEADGAGGGSPTPART